MMDQGRPECHLPEMPNFLLLCQNVVRLGLIPSPQLLLTPCPSFLPFLHPAPLKGELPRCVDEVYFIDEVSNCLFTIILWVLEINIQVTQDKWNAIGGARVPSRPKVIHPQRIIGGDVYSHSHHIELLNVRDELKGEEVRRHDACRLHSW